MTALTAGAQAPDIELTTMEGQVFSLRQALVRGPVLAAFFKGSCPVCQFAFPFLDRIYKAYGGKNVTIVGISQNEASETAKFIKQFGVTFPVLMDDLNTFPASNAYGLTNVPTLFWIGNDGQIEISSVGWSKQHVDAINRKAAETTSAQLKPVFRADEKIAEFRAG